MGLPTCLNEVGQSPRHFRGKVMAVENSNIGVVEEKVQDWQDEIESRVRSLQTGSYCLLYTSPSPRD